VTQIDDPCAYPFNETINEINTDLDGENLLIETFYTKLKESVMRRVQSIPTRCKACARESISMSGLG
jgi:hypothetical protein